MPRNEETKTEIREQHTWFGVRPRARTTNTSSFSDAFTPAYFRMYIMTMSYMKEEIQDNQSVISSSLLEFKVSKHDNQDDLQQTLSPSANDQEDDSDKTVDYFLSENSDVCHDSLRLGSITAKMDDVVVSDWKRLSVFEQSLNEELDLSILGWHIKESEFPGSMNVQDNYCVSEDDSDNTKSPSSIDLLSSLSEAIHSQFHSEDLGLPTISLLSNFDIQAYQEISAFEFNQPTEYTMEQRAQVAQSLLLFVREYIMPLSVSDLNAIFVGTVNTYPINEDHPCEDIIPTSTDHIRKSNYDVLPFRTVSIRIRIDVLCGAVMDAVQASIQNLNGEITKRQGGHLKAILPVFRYLDVMSIDQRNHSEPETLLPSIRLDIQLVSKRRSRENERILLIRAYTGKDVKTLPSNVFDLNRSEIGIYYDTNENRLIEAATSIQKLLFHSKMSQAANTSEALYSESADKTASHISKISLWQKRARNIAQELKNKSPLLKGKISPNISLDMTAAELLRDMGLESSLDISTERCTSKTHKYHIPILEQYDLSCFASSKLFIMTSLYELENRGLSYRYVRDVVFQLFPCLPLFI